MTNTLEVGVVYPGEWVHRTAELAQRLGFDDVPTEIGTYRSIVRELVKDQFISVDPSYWLSHVSELHGVLEDAAHSHFEPQLPTAAT